jgi:hypothetical protein
MGEGSRLTIHTSRSLGSGAIYAMVLERVAVMFEWRQTAQGASLSVVVMHVKCIHDLCSLLGNILSYLIVYQGPRHAFH